jgi:hypothetical protein
MRILPIGRMVEGASWRAVISDRNATLSFDGPRLRDVFYFPYLGVAA